MTTKWLGALALLAATSLSAQLVVYDDALQNGFLDYSYGGVPESGTSVSDPHNSGVSGHSIYFGH